MIEKPKSEWTNIPIKRDIVKMIVGIKIIPRESYGDAIKRVIKFYIEHK